MSDKILTIGDKKVKVSNPDKALYPTGFTKMEVVDYYRAVADIILPHLKDRPITMKRYPHGSDKDYFYEKRCPSFRPDWIQTGELPSEKEDPPFSCIVNNEAALVWVANLASLEIHPQLFLSSDVDTPTWMVFDLDPGAPADILDCTDIALKMRDILSDQGLKSYPKTSGGKGLHFYVPLNTRADFDKVKGYAKTLAQAFANEYPDKVVAKMSKKLREGKVFIDWSQNDQHKTTVSVYSLRARQKPTVSTPVTWDEVEQANKKRDASLLYFEAPDVIKRMDKMGDIFKDMLEVKQELK